MPQIIVIADSPAEDGAAQVLLRERVTERLFESGHFAKQLVERLGWAVGDAEVAEKGREARGEGVARTHAVTAEDVSAETLEPQPSGVVVAA